MMHENKLFKAQKTVLQLKLEKEVDKNKTVTHHIDES